MKPVLLPFVLVCFVANIAFASGEEVPLDNGEFSIDDASLNAGDGTAEESDAQEAHRAALEEQIMLLRDSYITPLRAAMESAFATSPDEWLAERAGGKFATWEDLEFELPQTPDYGVTETLYGFIVKDKASGATCRVRVVTRDMVLYYTLDFSKKVPDEFRRLMREVFENDRAIYYDASTPCSIDAVTCVNEYAQGTLGKLPAPKTKKSAKGGQKKK